MGGEGSGRLSSPWTRAARQRKAWPSACGYSTWRVHRDSSPTTTSRAIRTARSGWPGCRPPPRIDAQFWQFFVYWGQLRSEDWSGPDASFNRAPHGVPSLGASRAEEVPFGIWERVRWHWCKLPDRLCSPSWSMFRPPMSVPSLSVGVFLHLALLASLHLTHALPRLSP